MGHEITIVRCLQALMVLPSKKMFLKVDTAGKGNLECDGSG